MTTIDLSEIVLNPSKAISLKELSWDVQAEGLLVTCTARQKYRNTSGRKLEIVYTFPLSWNSVITGFAAILNGKRYVARALERKAAETEYESAIEKGDTPMMLEVNEEEGLCTANLGNILPDEELELEISSARLCTWDEGAVRISVPTFVADRYSDTGTQGGLLPHQRVHSNFLAEYPCSAHFELKGFLARGAVSCERNAFTVKHGEDAISVDMKCGYADRDITVTVSGLPPPPASLLARDGKNWVGCALFTPQTSERSDRPANLRVLVDCSGSMSGASIHQARLALEGLKEALRDTDRVTLTLFGSDVRHVITAPHACTAAFWRRDWIPAVSAIDADMGGTEMLSALKAAASLTGKKDEADILLITDGQVWGADDIARQVRGSGHRVFAVGVGVAPTEGTIRSLAQATGGDCAFVMPNEPFKETLGRFVAKIRKSPLGNAEPRLPGKPLWQSTLAANLFAGESTPLYALFKKRPDAAAMLQCKREGEAETLQAAPWAETDNPALAKLAAWARLQQLSDELDEEDLAAIAVQYGLLTNYTNLLLVSEREESEKTPEMPTLQSVPQMAAASGSGVLGFFADRIMPKALASGMRCRTAAYSAPVPADACCEDIMEGPAAMGPDPEEIARIDILDALAGTETLKRAIDQMWNEAVSAVLRLMDEHGLDAADAFCIALLWLESEGREVPDELLELSRRRVRNAGIAPEEFFSALTEA